MTEKRKGKKMGKHNEDIYLRTNRKELYKSMRDVLRDNPPEPVDPPPQLLEWWRIALIIGIIVLIMVFVSGIGHANEMKASYYSVQSLKKEGTWRVSNGIMANGKRFDENALTCATGKQYPLGSHLMVTNKSNGKSVVCKVTDRIGKRFYNSRIDLSLGAFKRLDSPTKGLLVVNVQRVAINVK